MEAAGLAVGIAGLAGLFSASIQAVDAISDFRSFGRDAAILDAQFNAERVRFQRWGEIVGLLRHGERGVACPESYSHHPALSNISVKAAVKELFEIVQSLCLAGRPLDGDKKSTDLPDKGGRSRAVPWDEGHSGSVSTRRKLKWSAKGKAARVQQVKVFGDLVQQLHNLVPPEGFKSDQLGVVCSAENEMAPAEVVIDQMHALKLAVPTNDGDVVSDLRAKVDQLEEEIRAESRRELRSWLLGQSLDLQQQELYDDSVKKRVDGTCDWVLDRPFFHSWHVSSERGEQNGDTIVESSRHQLLWIHGPAAFGKTVTCARIVEYLNAIDSPSRVASFFFSSELDSRDDPIVALRSWLAQLVSQESIALYACQRQWENEFSPTASRPVIMKLFRDIMPELPTYSFVIDGLDECSAAASGSVTIADFLFELRSAFRGGSSRLLIVSRDEPDIRQGLFGSCQQGRQCAQVKEYGIVPRDVEADTESYSRSLVKEKLARKTDTMKSDISERLSKRCEGQFLWIKMQGERLRSSLNKKQILAAIDETPTSLERLYDQGWTRITRYHRQDRERALSVLRWTAFALRPLTVGEIAEAVLLDGESNDFPVDELPDEVDQDYIDGEIKGLCGSLIDIRATDKDTPVVDRTVHLTHFTVRQFLLQKVLGGEVPLLANEKLRVMLEENEHASLAKLCLQYASFHRVWDDRIGESNGDDNNETATFLGSLRIYAAGGWFRHASLASQQNHEYVELAKRLFDKENPSWEPWRRWIDAQGLGLVKGLELRSEERPSSPLYYAALINLTVLVQHALEHSHNVDQASAGGVTPLGVSCFHGNTQAVQQLVAAGANVSKATDDGYTPLHSASELGHSEVVQVLLGIGADVLAVDVDEWCALHFAAQDGHAEVIEILLSRGADVSARTNQGAQPLHLAAIGGHTEAAQLLMASGADILAVDMAGWQPLYLAAYWGHTGVLRSLISHGADVSSIAENGGTALSIALQRSQMEVVKILVASGANVDEVIGGRSALGKAAASGDIHLATVLLTAGANTQTIENESRLSPLHVSAAGGHVGIAQLLIDHGADLMAVDAKGRTPLHAACGNGHVDFVRSLVAQGAKVSATDVGGNTPLHHACGTSQVEIVQHLVDHGADLGATNSGGDTQLHIACAMGRQDTVRYLIDRGVDISSTNNSGFNALHMVCWNGSHDIAAMLLRAGASTAHCAKGGMVGAHIAALFGHANVLQLLADSGAILDVVDDYDMTPLSIACAEGMLSIVKLLLPLSRQGVRVGKQRADFCGNVPLFTAARYGHAGIVREILIDDQNKDVLKQNWMGMIALHAAVCNGHREVVELLLPEFRENQLRRRDGFGLTPLDWARLSGDMELVSILSPHLTHQRSKDKVDGSPEDIATVPSVEGWVDGTAWCDACTLTVEGTQRYYSCFGCARFCLCTMCFDLGIKCPRASEGPTHSLALKPQEETEDTG